MALYFPNSLLSYRVADYHIGKGSIEKYETKKTPEENVM